MGLNTPLIKAYIANRNLHIIGCEESASSMPNVIKLHATN